MIGIIVAYDENRVIGNQGSIPWYFPEDLQLFKKVTTNSSIIMGRKTWESLPKKPLPNRANIVLSSKFIDNCILTCKSLEQALNLANSFFENIWIIGGEKVYQETITKNIADIIVASEVEGKYNGDAFFPELPDNWVKDNRVCEYKDKFSTFVYRKKEDIVRSI